MAGGGNRRGGRPKGSQRPGGSAGPKKYLGPQDLAAARRHQMQKWIGFGSIVVVVALVVGLVIAKVGGAGSPSGSTTSPPAGNPVAASITKKLTSVPVSTLVAAFPSGVVDAPQPITDPPLRADGKPDLLFIGAEFCPICATERWAMYVALSEFGTFSPPPGQIHSAVRDSDIETVTFYKTTYTSPYFTFTPVETTTNQPDGDYYVTLQIPTPAQQALWEAHTTESFPWLDFGGKMELSSAQYNPAVLVGQSFNTIAASVGNNSTVIGDDIDASARVLAKTICTTLTGNRPADVCSAVDG